MSGNGDDDTPETRAFRELETLVRHLGEELATFRRRAIAAEAHVRDGSHGSPTKAKSSTAGERLSELEAENASLRTRLEHAEDRVRQTMDRVRFLRQQLQMDVGSSGSARAGRS